jgi:hypothetical protein
LLWQCPDRMQVIRKDHGGFMPRSHVAERRPQRELCSANNPSRRSARLTVKK